jgi:2-oxoglutarate dehydrogenase E2 component (dihydrolipoamide succinyltransferase)
MPTDIVIPNLGESVPTGVVSQWLKNDGEYVQRDEVVLVLETDKVNMDLSAPASGVLKHAAKVGDVVPVGGVVGRVDESGAPPAPSSQAPAAAAASTTRPGKAEANGAPGKAKPAAAPAVVGAPAAPAQAESDVRATPLAKKLAQEHGLDLARVPGTGPAGRVREQDVLAAVQHKPVATAAAPLAPPAAGPAAAAPPGDRTIRRERMSPLRQRVAQRLVEAQQTAAMLTTFNECDMSAVIELRKTYKESFERKHGVGLGFMSFFVKAAVHALQQFPPVNASIVPPTTPGGPPEIEYHDYCDIAVAIGTPRGLVVPVVRDCQLLSFAQIESAIKDLAARAKDGRLALAELQGGTFTITNGGIYGSLNSTPILNPPQTGILGMHAIKNRPVEDPRNPGQVVIRPMMYLALSYDHRLIDGAEAVQFLLAIKNAIEDPQRLLLGV